MNAVQYQNVQPQPQNAVQYQNAQPQPQNAVQYQNVQPQPQNTMQYQQQQTLDDYIEKLPTDKLEPNPNEVQIVNTLFKEKKGVFDTILHDARDIILMGLLFIILNIPQINSLIFKFVPSAENSIYILIGIKTVLFMVIFYILKNIYLVRK